MWEWITSAVKSLFGGKGPLQIGAGNRSISNVTFGDNAQNIVVGEAKTSTPQFLPQAAEPQLSAFAKLILLDAAEDSDGKIYFGHTMFGHNLHAGKTEIKNCEDNREIAKIEAALRELQSLGAVDAYGNVGFKITHRGYELVASLKSPSKM